LKSRFKFHLSTLICILFVVAIWMFLNVQARTAEVSVWGPVIKSGNPDGIEIRTMLVRGWPVIFWYEEFGLEWGWFVADVLIGLVAILSAIATCQRLEERKKT